MRIKWNPEKVIAAVLVCTTVPVLTWTMLYGMSEPAGKVTLSPCSQEDSDNCYWDAAHRGNHQGTSFITLDGVTYYPEGK